MLNRVSNYTQLEKRSYRGGYRHRVYLGVQPSRQPNVSGLRDAVHRLIGVSRVCGGPEIEFYDEMPSGELRPEFETTMSSIARELLLNAICHSESKKALVTISRNDGHLLVRVQDWGAGFDPQSVPPDRCGLNGIRDLVRCLGGTIDIDSQPGAGTCVIIEIPLSQGNGTEPSGNRAQATRGRIVGRHAISVGGTCGDTCRELTVSV